ncbi:isochorismatase family protein [Naasia lichenicola]|uniref:Isochorismatase family protein n=1 Tax=Naasia lichenicola TaxID=2565933 RepID=A0A4V3WTU5_9MICO|nr:isochorismatase family protein [Naasia lichenicola]THG33307.1 isochorismatase family protein [Naasia lichenicola]
MTTPKPWLDLIPSDDVSSFQRGFDGASRPITAGSKPALVIVDMTLAFVDSAYPTGHSETGWPAVDANAELLAAARARDIPVFFTKAYADPAHEVHPLERGRWKTQGAPAAPSELPPGDVIVDALTPIAGEIVINKGSKPSGFFGTPLASYLVQAGVDTVIVTGMTTSGCVRATVLDAFMNNFHVIIPFEASADRSQISHKVNLFDMHMKYADVISVEETVEYLDSVTAAAAVPA